MTKSRLKFELIDGFESNGSAPQPTTRDAPAETLTSKMASMLNGSRHAPDQLLPSALNPVLLHDLAEGLEFLQRQLHDSESELERSREQSLQFEHDARRWEQEAARMRDESGETRRALDQLRLEFEDSRHDSQRQNEAIERIFEEVVEIRASRAHLEVLAAEQQRALSMSLELLSRVGVQEPSVANPVDLTADLEAKDCEIAGLKRLLEAAGEEGMHVDIQLAAARAELHSRHALWQSGQTDLAALSAALESARAELAFPRPEPESMSIAELPLPDPRIKELSEEKTRIEQKLRDTEAEVALQDAEVNSRGAIIIALESALEEQNTSLRTLEERFCAYADQVQSLQSARLEMPANGANGIVSKFVKLFSPADRDEDK